MDAFTSSPARRCSGRDLLLAAMALLVAGATRAQAPPGDSSTTTAPWEYSVSAGFYLLPDDDDYLQPTFAADRGALHLEARYNYEGFDTASFWVGCNATFGNEVTIDVTPMLGVAAGDTRGVAPGYHLSIGWKQLLFYSEGEYLFDAETKEDSYVFSWSELSWSPVDGMRIGVAGQRTRIYQSDREVEPGVLLGLSIGDLEMTAYVFNPGDEGTYYVASAVLDF